MQISNSVIELVGNTPLVRLNSVTAGIEATVLAKVEYLNPGGSVKDRIALRMIEDAEKSGALQPGGTIVEPTSGNTGIGLAIVAQTRGYSCVFVCPDKVAKDKIDVLRAYGARVEVCPTAVDPEDPRSYYSVSDRLARELPGAWKPDQYSNPANPRSHYETTGPELWTQTDGRITHFVAGMPLAHPLMVRSALPVSVPWWTLAPAYLAVSLLPIYYETRGEARSVSLTQVALAIGLVFVSPWHLLLARVVAGTVFALPIRRQSPTKAAFNITNCAFEVATAATIAGLFAPLTGPGPALWAALLLALLLSEVLSFLALQVLFAVLGVEHSRESTRSAVIGMLARRGQVR